MLQEGNRVHALHRRILSIPPVQERADASIRFMQAQVKDIDRELLDLLENGEWAEDALAQVQAGQVYLRRFFCGRGRYFDTGKEKVDFLFFGLVSGFEVEFGYFSLSELESAHGSLGLPIERDLYFEPKRLRELKEWHDQQRRISP